MVSEGQISNEERAVLKALAQRKNVILSGPPGTGKSRLMNRVARLFAWEKQDTGSSPTGEIPIPAEGSPLPVWFPSPNRDHERRVFPTVFDQNTKYRDFMRGLVPRVGKVGEFEVTHGTLYRAALHASQDGNAALVVIDEINRGPAVAAFGSALVGLESDKRSSPRNLASGSTQFFELLGDHGELVQFALPDDLYILAAMNEADSSVEPLDVAFLRRFYRHQLNPDYSVLRSYFGLQEADGTLPGKAQSALELYDGLCRALESVNRKIVLGRGRPYQLGHGSLMHSESVPNTMEGAFDYVSSAWATLRSHIDEVFFGNTYAVADVLRADSGDSPYTLEQEMFAGQSVNFISGPTVLSLEEIYGLMKSVAESR